MRKKDITNPIKKNTFSTIPRETENLKTSLSMFSMSLEKGMLIITDLAQTSNSKEMKKLLKSTVVKTENFITSISNFHDKFKQTLEDGKYDEIALMEKEK